MKVWLISCLLFKEPSTYAHRARLLFFADSEDAAIGIVTKEIIKDGFFLLDVDAVDVSGAIISFAAEMKEESVS